MDAAFHREVDEEIGKKEVAEGGGGGVDEGRGGRREGGGVRANQVVYKIDMQERL